MSGKTAAKSRHTTTARATAADCSPVATQATPAASGPVARTLAEAFPPSPACGCEICRAYCARPGWWTVAQAARALAAGLGGRMMLELSPDRAFGVLAPAFHGCEGTFALARHAGNGCTFLQAGLCALHATPHLPLECAYCHHARRGLGPSCHAALEADWRSPEGRALVRIWAEAYLRLPDARASERR